MSAWLVPAAGGTAEGPLVLLGIGASKTKPSLLLESPHSANDGVFEAEKP